MAELKTETTTTTPSIGDIYYVLFKHKWKIVGFTLAGLIAAAAVYRFWPDTVYRSEAKLFIRYIQESSMPLATAEDAQIKSTDQRGETVINGELEILMSMDLAKQVALSFGPERLLEAYGGGSDPDAAAAVIRGGLTVDAPHGSRVLNLAFEHPDQTIVQPVLTTLMAEYLKKHVEIHMTPGMFDDILSKETGSLRDQLIRTEAELRQLQDKAGILSLDETKRANAEQMSKLQRQIWDTSTEIAQRKAALEEYRRSQEPQQAVPAATMQEYRMAVGVLETQTQKYQELLTTFSPASSVMINLRRHIAANLEAKERLEAEYPVLAQTVSPAAGNAATGATEKSTIDIAGEESQIRVLAARLKIAQDDWERMRKAASEVGTLEMSLTDLQRRKELQESQYRYFSSSLEKARINEAFDGTRVSNISTIEAPTPPVRDVGKLYKVVAGLGVSGIGIGLALAFSLELFLDQTVRRPGEIESMLGLPLFFSLPNVRRSLSNGRSRIAALLPAPAGTGETRELGWPVHTELAPYFEALRDQLIFYFDVRGLTKKPKLIAVTSCGDRSGVSTVAAGLAAALSKAGEGNVLLVDMDHHAQHRFRAGSGRIGLDEFLNSEHRDEALVQDNLYAVPHATGNDRLERILPRRFTKIIPRLRESEYDYIIFDMPAVSQVSVTPQLARFMDMVFLLVESEKTNRDAVKRASNLLTQTSCTYSVIVNRTRQYLPRALLQEV